MLDALLANVEVDFAFIIAVVRDCFPIVVDGASGVLELLLDLLQALFSLSANGNLPEHRHVGLLYLLLCLLELRP